MREDTVGGLVARSERASNGRHRGCVVWLTGLPAAGKSTLATLAGRELQSRGRLAYVLDSAEDVQRTGGHAAQLAQAGFVVISALASPYCHDREFARSRCRTDFYEVYLHCPVHVCEARARQARGSNGASAPYERPALPDLILDTERIPAEIAAAMLVAYIDRKIRI